MNLSLQLKETIRYFLLPIPHGKEDHSVSAVISELQNSGLNLDKASYSMFLRNKYDIWKENGRLDATFQNVIGKAIAVSNEHYGQLFGEKYFEIHSSLQDNPFVPFSLASITLSYLNIIYFLAVEESMSAAKISRILITVDSRLSVISWKEVQVILRKLSCLPEIKQDQAENIYVVDEQLEEEFFGDADLKDASFQIGEVAKNLRFQYDAEYLLNTLSVGKDPYLPYLQILHYQCLISGFYDHVLSIPYEFSPRGKVANWLFSKWDNLTPTSNPILNNAKAVDILDRNWARSRKTNEFEKANVLVDILQGMDEMGLVASQELASWIRMWLVRYIKLNSEEPKLIEKDLTEVDIVAILEFIVNNPTQTYGILEQRLVDVFSTVLHPESEWRNRGLKDSVNTNNLSKRKLGDVDFQDSLGRRIVAYEAHGGTLNSVYYEGHIRTFKRSFDRRREELETISDISEWTIKIIFVAYDFQEGLKRSFSADNTNVEVEFVTFNQIMSDVRIDTPLFKRKFDSYFIDVLNDRRTPKSVREKITDLFLEI